MIKTVIASHTYGYLMLAFANFFYPFDVFLENVGKVRLPPRNRFSMWVRGIFSDMAQIQNKDLLG